MAIDRAVPLGLIVNEAVTKQQLGAAGLGKEGGRVSVEAKTGVGDGQAKLTVSDNGSGIEQREREKEDGLRIRITPDRLVGATYRW